MALSRSAIAASVALLLVGQAAYASTVQYAVAYQITTDVDNGGTPSSLVGQTFSGTFWVDPVTGSWNPASGNPASRAYVDFPQISVVWDTSVPNTGILGGAKIGYWSAGDPTKSVDGIIVGPPNPGGMAIEHLAGNGTFEIHENFGLSGNRIIYSGSVLSVTEVPTVPLPAALPAGLLGLGAIGSMSLLRRRR